MTKWHPYLNIVVKKHFLTYAAAIRNIFSLGPGRLQGHCCGADGGPAQFIDYGWEETHPKMSPLN